MKKIVAVLGMPGSGKTEASRIIEKFGLKRIRFGDVTENEIKKRGLIVNERNERLIREELRDIHGMDAYARLNKDKIDSYLNTRGVVIDGMRSEEEYQYLRKVYKDRLITVAIFTPLHVRFERITKRKDRPLTLEEIKSRDIAEIKNMNIALPIALANFTIINDTTITDLERKIKSLFSKLSHKS